MNVKEFETNKDAVNQIELKADYIPYIEKIADCKNIADVTSHKQITENKSVFVVDSPTRHLFFVMKLVQLYTNIEFDEMAISSAYDILNKTGALDYIFNTIPENEQKEWKSIMDMVMDDMYENEKSTSTILGNMKDSISMVVGSMISAMEEAVDNVE